MAVLLDTTGLPIRERADAYEAALNSAVFRSNVELDVDVAEPSARVEWYGLATGVDVVVTVSTGQKLRRTPTQIREAAPEQLSLAMALQGTTESHQGSRLYDTVGEVQAIEAMSPFRLKFGAPAAGPSAAMCFQIDIARLGLPVDRVRKAMPRLTESPLYECFRSHLAGLSAAAAAVEGTPASTLLGSATSELARALVASTASDDRVARESLAEVLCARVNAFIQRHLTDPDLNAERIAAAYGVSVRHLYAIFASHGLSLEQQIIRGRLEVARRALARPGATARTIESIARNAGFSHPQHFSRRFRQAYGVTPREWRKMTLSGAAN